VIALTSYTEPVTTKSAMDNIIQNIGLEPKREASHLEKIQNDYQENAKAQKNEEKEEQPSFAEVLAGVINNDDQTKPVKNKNDSLSLDQFNSENDLDIDLSFSMQELNLHSIASEEGFDVSEKNQNSFLNELIGGQSVFADQLFSEIAEAAEEEVNIDLLPKISLEDNPKDKISFLDKLKSKKEISVLENINKDTQLSEQTKLASSVAKQGTEEVKGDNENALSANKKRTVTESKAEIFLKSDNAKTTEQILSSLKKSSNENALSNNKQVLEEKPGKLEEMRGRKRDRITFEVRDQRTSDGSQMRTFYSVEAAASRLSGEASVKEITLELRLPEFSNSLQSAQTSWEARAANGSALETMLARELHQSFNGDIVRHASMALKDGGESTIRLALRPESLGNVKIQLEMSENKITGVILVESEEALNAFRKEMTALEQAFKEAGFADANLDLSLASDGRNARHEHEADIVSPQMAASSYEDSLRDSAELDIEALISAYGHGAGSLNILA